MHKNIHNENNLIEELYKDGIIKIKNILDTEILDKIIIAKNEIFTNFPFGQDKNYEKIDNGNTTTGDYPIKNLLDLNPIFKEIIKNEKIKYLTEKVLGKDYYLTNMSMRKIPNTDHILHTHRYYCGGLSFSLLLDYISLDQGETFFYKNSHKNPPPNFVDINDEKYEKISTTGNVGDMYFWFPDSWHGRNLNLTKNQTCILMGDFENTNTRRRSTYIYDKPSNNKMGFLNKIFSNIGNNPNNLFKHFIYCILRFKFLNKKVDKEKTIYTRLGLDNSFNDNFTFKDYLGKISIKKFFKVTILSTIKVFIGNKFYYKLKNAIKK